MQLAAVYGREVGSEVTTFGTTGFTYDDTFLIYDRLSASVWYPLDADSMTAVSGPMKGKRLPFVAKPERMTLREWRRQYPASLVLIPSAENGGDPEKPSAEKPSADGR